MANSKKEDIMVLNKDAIQSQNIAEIPLISPTIQKRVICRLFLLFVLLLIPTDALSITIIKNVGHGDCYVVISDGRVVVIDAGRKSNVNGLVSLLRTGYMHFDRIVITHVHSDHVGGLITAEQYVREQKNAALTADMLVSNHGEHDLNLVLRHEQIGPLMAELRSRPIVGMSDYAIAKLALNTEHLEVRGIALDKTVGASNENNTSLILKVTEIRDGIRRATLFLGDIEMAQQRALFSHPDAKEIFRDVAAVTLPHHGRPRTLLPTFFDELKSVSNENVIALHSDADPLDGSIAESAKQAGTEIKSTASPKNKESDVIVNLFTEKTYSQVGQQATSLSAFVATEGSELIGKNDFTIDEVVDAVAKYCKRSPSALLPPATKIPLPPKTWLAEEIRAQREFSSQHNEVLISLLRSGTPEQIARVNAALSKRIPQFTRRDIRRINEFSPGAIERWEKEDASPAERQIREGLAHGLLVTRSTNRDDDKLFIHERSSTRNSPGKLKYIVKKGPNDLWRIFGLDGQLLITMRQPLGLEISEYAKPKPTKVSSKPKPTKVTSKPKLGRVCAYCGSKAVGWCHMRNKYVCEEHRYFTQGGVRWRCP
jgi:beta-lactamase superfamily II metal-dependent hydrolase